jgi:hypothetical protein
MTREDCPRDDCIDWRFVHVPSWPAQEYSDEDAGSWQQHLERKYKRESHQFYPVGVIKHIFQAQNLTLKSEKKKNKRFVYFLMFRILSLGLEYIMRLSSALYRVRSCELWSFSVSFIYEKAIQDSAAIVLLRIYGTASEGQTCEIHERRGAPTCGSPTPRERTTESGVKY